MDLRRPSLSLFPLPIVRRRRQQRKIIIIILLSKSGPHKGSDDVPSESLYRVLLSLAAIPRERERRRGFYICLPPLRA